MQMPITLMYASLFAIFALYLSFGAGSMRGKSGASIMYGEPINMALAEKVRRHQNFLEYMPMFLIVFAAIETQRRFVLVSIRRRRSVVDRSDRACDRFEA